MQDLASYTKILNNIFIKYFDDYTIPFGDIFSK